MPPISTGIPAAPVLPTPKLPSAPAFKPPSVPTVPNLLPENRI
jgi:hypothetical protein